MATAIAVDPVAIRMAAQCWTLPETKHIVMDTTLCAALSLEFEKLVELIKQAAPTMIQERNRREGASAQPYHEWLTKYEELVVRK